MKVNDGIELFVPGRLCLFGEHSDWAGQMRKFNSEIAPGKALVACTEEGIYATARICDTLKLRTVSPSGDVLHFESAFKSDELHRIASEGGYFSYVAGVAAYISTYYDIGGIEIDCYKMTLPQKKGLSSSAAICTLIARAFSRLYGLNLTVRGEMEAAYHGEQLTQSRCGRLDQACAYGRGVVSMRFDGDVLDVAPVEVGADLHLVFADLNACKDTITILRDLNSAYPFPRTEQHRELHELLGMRNMGIISRASSALNEGNGVELGRLMNEAQELFDRYAAPLSPVELKSEKLHSILSDENINDWVFGGKGVGSQGDGSVQFIAKSKEDQQYLLHYLRDKLGLDGYSLTLPKTKAVRKAVIPVAGYGTRMYPATKLVKKEFFPVIDTDGHAKPVLLVILNELINAGIDEVCLVIQPGDESLYLSLFEKLGAEHKLSDGLRKYEGELSSLKDKITFAYQDRMLGFGHAVLQSAMFASGEPVLLLLGDHIYRSRGSENCAAQLISAYEKTGALTIGLFEISPEDVVKYGVVKGDFVGDDEQIIKLQTLVEKPSAPYAKANLGVKGNQYAVFMYVLTPEVYNMLDRQYTNGKTEQDELQLTPALDAVAQESGAYGIMINGERFDIGLPNEYRDTVARFGL